MTLRVFRMAIAAGALTFAALSVFVPARAQSQHPAVQDNDDDLPPLPPNRPEGIPCRISWHEDTSGGDTFTTDGKLTLTRFAPQGNGKFVAFGSGRATVTYHSANHCRIGRGSPWTAKYEVTIASEDGRLAQVDIGTTDESRKIETYCLGNKLFYADYDPPEPPSVTVPLQEGTTPFNVAHGAGAHRAGHSGSVTLHYCYPSGK